MTRGHTSSALCRGPFRLRSEPIKICNKALVSSLSTSKNPPPTLIKSLPNIITSARIACCPFLTYAIANDMKGVALCGCIAAGVTDWLDGYIARKYDAAVSFIFLIASI